MEKLSRREFTGGALGSVLTWSLLETLFENEAFGDDLKPITGKWLAEVSEVSQDLKDEKVKQVIWQEKVEELFSKVRLDELLELVDFERLRKNLKIKAKSETSLRFNFKKAEGAPSRVAFGKQIFALNKGNSVIPHGHNNMATAFLVLKGNFQGRLYDRVEDAKSHMIIKPTIDDRFGPGTTSSISDAKDNVHWFKALDEPAFIFNIHVLGLKTRKDTRTGRVYVDPKGEKLDDGLVRAPLLDYKKAHQLYG